MHKVLLPLVLVFSLFAFLSGAVDTLEQMQQDEADSYEEDGLEWQTENSTPSRVKRQAAVSATIADATAMETNFDIAAEDQEDPSYSENYKSSDYAQGNLTYSTNFTSAGFTCENVAALMLPYNTTKPTCRLAATDFCKSLSGNNVARNQWVSSSRFTKDWQYGCYLAFYMPTNSGPASYERCMDEIVGPMIDNCVEDFGPNVHSTVNLYSDGSFVDPNFLAIVLRGVVAPDWTPPVQSYRGLLESDTADYPSDSAYAEYLEEEWYDNSTFYNATFGNATWLALYNNTLLDNSTLYDNSTFDNSTLFNSSFFDNSSDITDLLDNSTDLGSGNIVLNQTELDDETS
ncbi:MAG: hypothetical protein M1827_007219 [Pycnora praestabilis]|nr:MAG: hypothetical protein M1827_007219 [Pycnora praestabilis]